MSDLARVFIHCQTGKLAVLRRAAYLSGQGLASESHASIRLDPTLREVNGAGIVEANRRICKWTFWNIGPCLLHRRSHKAGN